MEILVHIGAYKVRKRVLVIEPKLEVCCCLRVMAFHVSDTVKIPHTSPYISPAVTLGQRYYDSPFTFAVHLVLRECDIVVINAHTTS